MIEAGTELIVGAVQHDRFGAAVIVGAGGVQSDVLADRAVRLAPLASSDPAEMLAELRMAPVLDGYRGAVPVPVSDCPTC